MITRPGARSRSVACSAAIRPRNTRKRSTNSGAATGSTTCDVALTRSGRSAPLYRGGKSNSTESDDDSPLTGSANTGRDRYLTRR
ncbi:hypothetical protein B0I31_105185 [Saccharothrix carnea]|uniref:Uncharacterized protein n=1 Tax=Saccharothrix carnea TaxID=1280637 RepID=A0A2P8I9S8_SACCR|nr:hypothetical protein B0I31_105185 [Saccharothrix carnea]